MSNEKQTFEQWAWMRLTAIVTAGRSDLRYLRNRFGLAVQGKLNAATAITNREREDAQYHIEKGDL